MNITQNTEDDKTQCELILEHFKKYGSITPWDAVERYRCLRLGARIYDLRQRGYRIATYPEKAKSGKTYARYFLKGEPQ